MKPEDQKGLQQNLARICEAEIETYIYHELGEMRDTVFDRDIWRGIVSTFPHTPIELLARSVKDILADVNEYGTLRHITSQRKTSSMALYVAFLDGLRKVLLPELFEAFEGFVGSGDWGLLEQAISHGYNTAKHHAEVMCSTYKEGKQKDDMEWVQNEIKEQLLIPLGVGN